MTKQLFFIICIFILSSQKKPLRTTELQRRIFIQILSSTSKCFSDIFAALVREKENIFGFCTDFNIW